MRPPLDTQSPAVSVITGADVLLELDSLHSIARLNFWVQTSQILLGSDIRHIHSKCTRCVHFFLGDVTKNGEIEFPSLCPGGKAASQLLKQHLEMSPLPVSDFDVYQKRVDEVIAERDKKLDPMNRWLDVCETIPGLKTGWIASCGHCPSTKCMACRWSCSLRERWLTICAVCGLRVCFDCALKIKK